MISLGKDSCQTFYHNHGEINLQACGIWHSGLSTNRKQWKIVTAFLKYLLSSSPLYTVSFNKGSNTVDVLISDCGNIYFLTCPWLPRLEALVCTGMGFTLIHYLKSVNGKEGRYRLLENFWKYNPEKDWRVIFQAEDWWIRKPGQRGAGTDNDKSIGIFSYILNTRINHTVHSVHKVNRDTGCLCCMHSLSCY